MTQFSFLMNTSKNIPTLYAIDYTECLKVLLWENEQNQKGL